MTDVETQEVVTPPSEVDPKATTAPVEAPKPKAAGSRAFLDSLGATRADRQAQLSWRQEKQNLEKEIAALKPVGELKTKIEAARARGDINELHKLLEIPPEATRAFFAQHGAPKPDDKLSLVERQLKETQDRLKAFEEEQSKAKQAVGNREQEKAAEEFINEVHGEVDKFPLTALLKQGSAVVSELQKEAKATGRVPDVEKVKARVEAGFRGLVESILDSPKGLEVLEALIAKKRGSAGKVAPKENTGPKVHLAEKQGSTVREVKFGGYKSELDQAMAEAEAEVAAKK
jgi:hypothetical protein